MTLTQRLPFIIYPLLILGLSLLPLFSGNPLHAKTDSDTAASKTSDQTTQKNEDKSADDDNAESATSEAESQIEDSMANIEIIQQTLEALRSEIENSKEKTSLNRSSVKTIKEGLELIDEKLKEAYSGLDESKTGINTNTKALNQMGKKLLTKTREIRANAADLVSQKSLIEDNSIRLYELLIQISNTSDKVERLANALDSVKKTDYTKKLKTEVYTNINKLWMLLSIILVFLSPLAFVLSSNRNQYKPLTDGIAQHQGVLMVCLTVFLGFFTIGFGLMYGTTSSGLIGTTTYLLENVATDSSITPIQTNRPFTEFVLYQAGFAMLAAMIVYMTVGRQLSSTKHMLLALFVGAVLIPVFGHWTWSSHFVTGNLGWLEGAGFIDEAGSITINTVAACFALIIIIKLSRSSPPPHRADQEVDDPVYSTSAVLILWLSWLGFTTATLPIDDEQISTLMLNVGLAGSAGGLSAFLHYAFFSNPNNRIASGLGGFVSGLVAIAACAQSVTFAEAAVIGASAGLLQNFGFSFLRKTYLKQAWQTRAAHLIAIHGVGGIWGALCVGLLAPEGNFGPLNISQLVIQTQGIAAALVYSFVMANIIMFVLNFRRKTTTPL
ncbi:MAG: Ammonium transporter [uncultured Thiotrichaceae bacterium]|uniref:Ammonium transporter n=1 Tax=uncultured Thiotrichaceae bacterium TaxID=298394 RepID=A0A6S6UL00_9GAMM|nr:MAG: Ammonium transporter [uncultured Thiotrichaceae bacterium]